MEDDDEIASIPLPGDDDDRYQARPCSDCTACCKVMAVPELEKPVGEWCRHCSNGENGQTRGCRVYEKRPAACRTFVCLWSHGAKFLNDDDKPTNIKVFLYSFKDRFGDPAIGFAELVPDALNRKRVRELVDEIVTTGFTVRYRHHDGEVNWIEGGQRWKRYLTVDAIDLPGVADDGRVIDPAKR